MLIILPRWMVLVERLHVDVHWGGFVLADLAPVGPSCFPQGQQVARLDLGSLRMMSAVRILEQTLRLMDVSKTVSAGAQNKSGRASTALPWANYTTEELDSLLFVSILNILPWVIIACGHRPKTKELL